MKNTETTITAEFKKCYPKDEHRVLEKLDVLMESWAEKWANDSHTDKHRFKTDGFYPYYFHQKPRVLFIGRDTYNEESTESWETRSYLNGYYNSFVKGEGARYSLDNSIEIFHSRLFYMMHAINMGFPKRDWGKVPFSEKIAMGDFKKGKLSFAFMNLCKITKEGEDPSADWSVIRPFVDSYYAEIRQEIEILDPDIIITANLFAPLGKKRMRLIFGDWEDVDSNIEGGVNIRKVNDRPMYIFDTFHFSRLPRSEGGTYDYFYAPVRDAYKEIKQHIRK